MTSDGFRLHHRQPRPLQFQRGLKLSLLALFLSSPAFGLAVATTTSLTTSPNPSFLGATVTLTATVSPAFAPGQVTFYNGPTLLGLVPLVSGTATLQIPFSAGGTYSLRAVYSGGQTISPNQTIVYSSSTSPVVTQTVLIFLNAPTYATDTSPVSAAVGDFNGDGKPDLVVANSIGANVSVLLNNGGGTFLAPVNYSVGDNPTSVAVGDFNGDGKLDVVCTAAGPQGAGLWVLLGNGDGTFRVILSQPTGISPSSIAVGDFNGDGKPDLAVASRTSSGGVNVLIGKGDGTFSAPVYYATDTVSTSVAVSDFNLDGKPDLVVVNSGSDNVSVLLGKGDGTFQVLMHFGSGFGEGTVAVGDFNADGKPDFAVSIQSGVTVYLGKGDGTFQAQANYPAPLAGGSVAVGDFNGDGRPDFALVGSSNNTVSVLLGNGNGTFQTATAYLVGIGPSSAAVGDFNGDGKADLAVTDAGPFATGAAGFVSILLGNGNGTFQTAPDYAVTNSPSSVAVGDFNGDGKADLAVADGVVSVFLGNGDGTFQAAVNYPAGTTGVSVAAGDFNGDGKMDLAVADSGGGVSVLLGNGDGTFQAAVSYPTAAGPSSIAVGDFNGDGKADLAVANSTGNYVSVLLGNGNGTFRAAVNYPAGTAPRSVAVGDVNGDGKADLAVANFGISQLNNFVQGNISVLLGNGDGTFKPAVNYTAGGNPASVAIGDFNGDGKPDLAVAAYGGAVGNDGAWVLLGNGNGTFQAAIYNPADVLPQAIVVGDFNSDGRADLAVANSFSGDVSVLLGYGNGTFQPAVNYTVGVTPVGLAAGDFNGDARADLAVANNMGGGLTVLLSYEPRLTITKTHAGNFFPGQQNATYQVTVSNRSNAGSTSGLVTVTDTLPAGLTLVSMAGAGWTCSSSTCTRSDPLAGGASYPPVTVTVNVAANATSPQVNAARVSGGGSAAANTTDSTTIGSAATLSVSKTKLNFGVAGLTISDPQTVAVLFSGGAAGSWTAVSNQANIAVSPASGVGSGTFLVTAMPGPSGTVTVTSPGAINSPQQIQVNITTVAAAAPFGSFDTPLDNTTGIAGAIPVTGWALDNVGVASLGIYREPIGSETAGANGLMYVGNATIVSGARPDVETRFPNTPQNYRAGWGYMLLTNFLPNGNGTPGLGNGTYRLHAIATNKGGMTTDLGTRTITVDNAHASKPFGTIDTPDQGATASGNAYVNFGWALTQNPYCIPTDGSTITAYIDGAPVGHPAYGQRRNDIVSLFPGLCNTNTAVGFFYIDTTKLANGVHTIFWTVSDSANRSDGIGSRYFTVQNSGTGPVAAPEDVSRQLSGQNVPEAIEVEEVGRLELPVGAASGYLSVNGERRPLPIGSTLQDGVFYWQPGPGFLGDYDVVLVRPGGEHVPVHVKVRPKRW